jgi:hypothetical protein
VTAIVLDRLRDLFLTADAAPSPRFARQVAERATPATLGVLVAPGDAPVAGAALALAAAVGRRAPCALICHWTGAAPAEPPRSGLAASATRKLARRLMTRGLAAGACGRLVTVALPAADIEACAATERALAAAGDVPLVLVVAGPRPPALDPLLATLDRLIVIPPPGAPHGLEPLALTAAAHLGRSAALLHRPTTTSGRLLTATGLPLSPAWRTAAAAALRGGDD